MSAFHLRKWYLDVVSNDGVAAILYWARLEWGLASVRYSASLLSEPDARLSSQASLSQLKEPEENDGIIVWNAPSLGVNGQWNSTAPPHEQTLFESDTGQVRWRCCQPAADVTLDLKGLPIRGRGYAEVVDLTIPPWQLPIHELRWGRALTHGQSMVWIEWRGPEPRSIVLTNGELSSTPLVDDRSITARGARTSLSDARTLRDAPLGTSLLADVPGLRNWASAAMLQARETKWLSRACIERTGTPTEEGWAIHEVVRFRT
jgi:hypothetical protein